MNGYQPKDIYGGKLPPTTTSGSNAVTHKSKEKLKYWIDRGKGHDPRFFCPVCGNDAGFYFVEEGNGFRCHINRFCGVCGERLHSGLFGFQKEGAEQ